MLTASNLKHIFGKSPLPLLRRHLELGIQCSEQIPQMLVAMSVNDTGTLQALKFKVNTLAQQADEISGELARDWPKGVLVPTRRQDVLLVLESQERIIDVAQKIAALTQLGLEIPAEISKLKVALAERCIKTCRQVHQVIDSLDLVLKSGFNGSDLSNLYRLAEDVRKNNNEVRTLGDDLSAVLYEHRNDQDAISLVFAFRLVDLFGGLSAHAKVAGQRALMLVSR